jgi:hypothetical protein
LAFPAEPSCLALLDGRFGIRTTNLTVSGLFLIVTAVFSGKKAVGFPCFLRLVFRAWKDEGQFDSGLRPSS